MDKEKANLFFAIAGALMAHSLEKVVPTKSAKAMISGIKQDCKSEIESIQEEAVKEVENLTANVPSILQKIARRLVSGGAEILKEHIDNCNLDSNYCQKQIQEEKKNL